MPRTYLQDMQDKHPDLTEDEIAREFCLIEEYKPDELCDRQPGGDCFECWSQQKEEK